MLRSGGIYSFKRSERFGGTENKEPSRTVQDGKDEADINVLVRRFGVTGSINGIARPPALTEFGEIFDFQTAMDMINAANRSFMEMSAETRARFMNDPGRFVEFCSKEENLDEMRKMGLAVPKKEVVVPEPVRVQVVNSPVPPA